MSMRLERVFMECADPQERSQNFEEVALGYTEEQAVSEAERCLQCKNPKCRMGCPVEVLIPQFIKKIAERDFLGAAAILKEKSFLPAVCGRVCPQETQCEEICIVGIKGEPVAIGRLERFAADYERKHGMKMPEKQAPTGKKVAVVGGGPAGLTAAYDLALLGHDVTVFEALHVAGGVLMYGIPEFRLPKEIVETDIELLKSFGVKVVCNAVVGKSFTVNQLMEEKGFDAVFIGTGAGLPRFMNIPGENFNGVYSANEFLTRVNLMKAFKFPEYGTPIRVGEKVAVLGAGNVAMDAARTAVRLGAEATIIYRRSRAEMPARHEEIEHAEEEGVKFVLLTNPKQVVGDENGRVSGIECVKMELGEPDASGRRSPKAVAGSEHVLPFDTVVVAIGQGPNPLVTTTTRGLELNKWGNIAADEDGQTSIPGVYAGGDIVTGAATVILAMGAGKKAARAIDEYLKQK